MANATTTSPNHLGRSAASLRNALKWLVVLVFGLAVAFVAVRYGRSRPNSLVQYDTAAIDRGPIAAKVTATGAVSALVTVQVGSQVSGRIDKLFADFGSQVKKGQTIATIDPALFQAAVSRERANHSSAVAAVARARANFSKAEKDFTRAKVLISEGIMSRADYDAAEAALKAARADVTVSQAAVEQSEAALKQAELNLYYTTIISPIDGVVISRNVDVGQTVAATFQAPVLFTIAQDLTKMQVDTNVAEADVGKVTQGMKVTFTVDAYPTRTFQGVVRQVRDNATTLQNVVTYDAVIDVDNSDGALKPGMTASVTFNYATRDDVLRLPNAALRFKPDPATLSAMGASAPPELHGGDRAVWALRGERPVLVIAKTGITDGTYTEVLSGDLRVGDRAVIEAKVPQSAKKGP